MASVYRIIKTKKELKRVIRACKKTRYCSFDFETSGHPHHSPLGYPTILGISFQPGSSWILPLGHFDSPFNIPHTPEKDQPWLKLLRLFSKEVLEDKEIVKVAWNFKFEYVWLKRYDCKIYGRVFDGMLAKYLLNEERPNDLKSQVSKYIPEFAGYEENYPGSKLLWDEKPLEGLSKYCGLDTDNTLRLMLFFENQLINNELYHLFRNMLMMASYVLGDSEFEGFPVNVPYLDGLLVKYENLIQECENSLRSNKYIKKFEKWQFEERLEKLINKIELEIEDIEEEIETLSETKKAKKENEKKINQKLKTIKTREDKIDRYRAGDIGTTKNELALKDPINFSSPGQMGLLFFTSPKGFKFPIIKYTTDKWKNETDNPSTDESVLLELEKIDKTGFCKSLLEYRGLTKMYSTFIKGMREKVSVGERIHGRYNLHQTVTGRLCVSRDCLILTNIGEIEIGDIVPNQEGIYDYNGNLEVITHTGEYKPITHVINKGYEIMFEVELENGKTIKCTENHRFLTDKGWLKLKDITDENIICWDNIKDI